VNVLTRTPGVVNQQAGLGKTTLGMPRAHALVHRGTEVCIVDAGPPTTAPDLAPRPLMGHHLPDIRCVSEDRWDKGTPGSGTVRPYGWRPSGGLSGSHGQSFTAPEPAHDELSADPSDLSRLDIEAVVGIGTIICADVAGNSRCVHHVCPSSQPDAADAGDVPCSGPEHHEQRGPARRLTSAAAHASGRPEAGGHRH
jgi:hypothetical protein